MTTQDPEKGHLKIVTHCGKIGRPGMIRLVLHLAAIAVICFAIGFGILALSGEAGVMGMDPSGVLNKSAFFTPEIMIIPLDDAQSADIGIVFGTGNLQVRSGGVGLLTSTSYGQYPIVEVTTTSSEKIVKIAQRSGHPAFPTHWDILVKDRVPVALNVTVGTGDVLLDIGGLNLTSLQVFTGIGDAMIDLAGYEGGDFTGTVTQNIGDLTIRVPKNRNVTVSAGNQVGNVKATGFSRQGGMFSTTGHPGIEITVTQGLGSITLEEV